MLKSLVSVCSILVLLFPTVLVPTRAQACPVKLPETLLSLYRSSDAIYIATFAKEEQVSITEDTEDYTATEIKKHFDISSTLKGEPRPYAVVAIRDSHVAFMPRQTFLWLIDDSRAFSRWVIDQLNARLGHYVALVESFRLHDVTARVAYCVSELFNPHLYPATGRELVISQEEIARLCGLARQNTNRALHKLEQSGLLRIRYGVIEVLDLQALQNFARGL